MSAMRAEAAVAADMDTAVDGTAAVAADLNPRSWQARGGTRRHREGAWHGREGAWHGREGTWQGGDGTWQGRDGGAAQAGARLADVIRLPVARHAEERDRLPLRLTRRGRIVAAGAAALIVGAASMLAASAAQATSHALPARLADRVIAQVVVRPGESLWSVAENADPDADTRLVIQQIVELNSLTGDVVFAGERLYVPRG